MQRNLRNKLPKVTITPERLSEGECLSLIQENNAMPKQKQKMYVDKHWLACTNDTQEGDTILVKQLHKANKLMPNFEPVPSLVFQKGGNALIVRSPGGTQRMPRNLFRLL